MPRPNPEILGQVTQTITNLFQHLFLQEGKKGCDPTIHRVLVDIEPRFSIFDPRVAMRNQEDGEIRESYVPLDVKPNKPIYLKVWPSKHDKLDWKDAENFLKVVVPSSVISFELIGNCQKIELQLVILDKLDLPTVRNALKVNYPEAHAEQQDNDLLSKYLTLKKLNGTKTHAFEFMDYCPMNSLYCKNFTEPAELGNSPLKILLHAINELNPDEFAFYQVIFKPTSPQNNWHRNVEILTDIEFKTTTQSEYANPRTSWFSQTPSLYVPELSKRETAKAHRDKPFFAAVVRIGVFCGKKYQHETVKSLNSFMSNFLHGGRGFSFLTSRDYLKVLKDKQKILNMFISRTTHRPGFLLNSAELSGLCHLPSGSHDEDRPHNLDIIEGFAVPEKLAVSGVTLGYNERITITKVKLPDEMRYSHAYLLGKTDTGKSGLMGNMLLDDARRGKGAILLMEPHGDLTDDVLDSIPESRKDDVIFFNPADLEWTPCFNPVDIEGYEDISRIAEDFVALMKSILPSWGARMENIIRQMFYALLATPRTTLLDSQILLSKSPEGEQFRAKMLPYLSNPSARRFWEEDFKKYTPEMLDPVLNKLGQFFLNDKTHRIFSQVENKISIREIIDSNKILLISIPSGVLGYATANILGSFLFSHIHKAVLSRADTPEDKRKPVYIYGDEFHRFHCDVQAFLTEARKYKASATLAYQIRGQANPEVRQALGNVGTVICFGLELDDAKRMVNEFRGKIDVNDLLTLGKGEVYARIGNDIVNFKTYPPSKRKKTFCRDYIIENTRRNYCVKVDKKATRNRETSSPRRELDTF